MALILRPTPVGRRVFNIDDADLAHMLDEGKAVLCSGYQIYEEVTDEERSQGYLTRNMAALPIAKRRGRPPKMRGDAE